MASEVHMAPPMLEQRVASAVPLTVLGGRFRSQSPAVAVVSDDTGPRRAYAGQLRAEGYTAHAADGAGSAMVLPRDLDPSITVVDLPPLERMKLVDALMHVDPGAPVYVVNDECGQDLRTAVASLRRRDDAELPPGV